MSDSNDAYDYADLSDITVSWPVEIIRGTSSCTDNIIYTFIVEVPKDEYDLIPKTPTGAYQLSMNLLDSVDDALVSLFEGDTTEEPYCCDWADVPHHCADCGTVLQEVRPGKYQCPICE